ncbi:MAG: alpha/beta hydrolase, partial [Ruminococcus flavefaciens]|nr:alpha/beta hydrolase [Ruminococcus flavefaciens]
NPEDRAYSEKLFETFTANGKGLPFVGKESIRNQFYSDLITPLEDNISVKGTTVHVFYAVKMGELYEERYRQHFRNPDICRHNYQHEELLFCYPEKWYREVLRVCGM